MDYKDWLLPAATKSTFAKFSLISVTCGSLSTHLETEAIVPDAKDGGQASSNLKVFESSVRGPEFSPQSFPASLQLISQINVSTLPDINSTVNGKASTPVTYDVQPEYVAGPSEPIKTCRDGRDSYKRKILAIRNLKKRYSSLSNLKRHVILHTSGKLWQCGVCGKRLGSKWSLELHHKSHSGQRVLCPYCPQTFTSTKDLRRHDLTHTKQRPYQCCLCLTRFARKDNLCRHIQTVHNQTKTISWQLALNSEAQNLLSASRQAALTGVVTATETMDTGPCIVDVFTLVDAAAAATLTESSSS